MPNKEVLHHIQRSCVRKKEHFIEKILGRTFRRWVGMLNNRFGEMIIINEKQDGCLLKSVAVDRSEDGGEMY